MRNADSERIVSIADAYVERADDRWTIGNSDIRYALRASRGRTLTLEGLILGGSDEVLTASREPDALITVGGETFRLGASGSPFSIENVAAAEGSHFVSLSIRFKSNKHGLTATRRYVVYPGCACRRAVDGVRGR